MFERPKTGERTILVHIDFLDNKTREDWEEFQELAGSAGAEIISLVRGTRAVPDAKYFVGQGKAEQIRDNVLGLDGQLVIFNHSLTPAQERNLETLFQCRVLDRTGLILDIFAQRAKSFEGKLQVELAQLHHIATRLVRGWTHLERQRGGIGLRGPGETQLETDRRLIRNRIKTINDRLAKVRVQRDQSRRARRRALLPTVAIVGYTNVGKSTLFNKLSGASVYVANQLFATLDPTLRKLPISGAGTVILADTVGFIRHLPHDLVNAFRATLEETRDASLLLHVIDIHDPDREAHAEQVKEVLAQIKADQVPQLLIYNKIDCVENCVPGIERDNQGRPIRVRISATKSQGLELVRQAIGELVFGDPVYRTLLLTPEQGRLRSKLYDMDTVLNERIDEAGNWIIAIRMGRQDFESMFPKENLELDLQLPIEKTIT